MTRISVRRPIRWRRMGRSMVALAGGLLASAVALAQGPGFWRQPSVDAGGIAGRCRDSVVTVRAELGERKRRQGTGFMLEPGYLVTALHVIDGARKVWVESPDGRRSERIVVQAVDVENDLALLEVGGMELTAMPLGDPPQPAVGDRVTVISNPLGLTQTVTEGIVSGFREAADPDRSEQKFLAILLPARLLQISAAISPGSSGGPVFGKSGALVGVAVAGVFYGAADLNFAVPADVLPALLDQRRGLDLDSFRERVGEARSRLADPHLFEAELAYELGDRERTERQLARALSYHPDLVEALILQSELLVEDDELTAARDLLLQATEHDPESAEAWSRLGRVYHLIGTRRDLDRAVECFEEALELEANHAQALFGLGELRFELGLYPSAIRAFEMAFEADPEHLEAGTRLGEAHLMADRTFAAQEVLEDVLSIDPGWTVAHQVLARVYARQGLEGEARRHFGEFLELSEDDPELGRLRERTIQYLRRYPNLIPIGMRREVAEG